jgi:alpha-glucoside transport system permease protein
MAASAQIQRNSGPTAFQRFLSAAPLRIVVILICFLWTLPTAGLLISSFRAPAAIRTTGWWTVFATPFDFTQWTLENYQDVILADGMGNAFLNSLIVTIPATVIPITIAAFAAYAFAWMRFPGRDFFFAVVVGLLVVPLQMALIPMLRLYVSLDLNGTFLGIWLAHTGFGLPLAVYLLYGYISQLPRDLFESASIDGASHFTAFTQLVLPLSVPAIASFTIFQFLWVWNDLLVALVFLGTKREVAIVTSRLSEMVGSRGQDWHILTAGAFITMILPLIVFFSLQRYFVRGLLAGSVKG